MIDNPYLKTLIIIYRFDRRNVFEELLETFTIEKCSKLGHCEVFKTFRCRITLQKGRPPKDSFVMYFRII